MAEIWTVNLTAADRAQVDQLAKRRLALGLPARYTETLRAAVALAMTASDDELKRGEL